jgi:hypothetical protein
MLKKIVTYIFDRCVSASMLEKKMNKFKISGSHSQPLDGVIINHSLQESRRTLLNPLHITFPRVLRKIGPFQARYLW